MMDFRVANRKLEIDLIGDGDYEVLCENVYIYGKTKDFLTGKETVRIAAEIGPVGDVRFELPRQEIDSKVIPRLLTYGLTCVDNTTNNELLQYILFDSESSAKTKYTHDRLGFVKGSDGKDIFLLHHPVGENVAKKRMSTYKFPDFTKPRGCLVGWKAAVEKYVYGRGFMELALAIGAVAPIAHILLMDNEVSEVPLYALIGDSSSGKTTSLILCASIWYSSKMVSDFNCTQNAFTAQLSRNRGIPMLIDEASAVPDWNFTNLLYNLPKGCSKLRCSNDGSLRERHYFSGAIVFTGEKSLFEQSDKNRGVDARMLEFNLPWTENAKHADDIIREFGRHYAVAAPVLVEWIMKNKAEVKKVYARAKRSFERHCCDVDNVLKRLFKHCSMIITAAYALNTSLGLKLNYEELFATMLYIINEKNKAFKDSPEKWYADLLAFILDHADCFPEKENILKSRKIWGLKTLYKTEPIVWIRENIFEDFFKENTTFKINDIRQLMANKGYIWQDNSRHYKVTKTINGVKVCCYGVYLNFPRKSFKKNKAKQEAKSINLLE